MFVVEGYDGVVISAVSIAANAFAVFAAGAAAAAAIVARNCYS